MGLERWGQVGFSEARKGMANGYGLVWLGEVRKGLVGQCSVRYGF